MAPIGWFRNREQSTRNPGQAGTRINVSQSVIPTPAELPPRKSRPSADLEAALSPTWFSAKQVEEYRKFDNEDALARAITEADPSASREEILFRYKLSRAVFLKDFELPMLPASATQVMSLSRCEGAGAKDYVKVIQADPSLVGAVVRLSNSALFSGNQEYNTLEQSVVRIGLKEIEKIAMLHAFNSKLFRVPGYNELVAKLVQHGVNVSFASQAVARALKVPGIEPFLAGLLHNVGKLIVLQTIGNVQKQLDWMAPTPLVESAFEAFHTAVGQLICGCWELPDTVGEAVRWHQDPGKAAGKTLSQSVYLGNRLCQVLEDFETPGAEPDEPKDQVDSIVATTVVEDQDYSTDAWIAGDTVMIAAGLNPERMEIIRTDLAAELQVFHGSVAAS